MATMRTRQESSFYQETLPNGLQLLGQEIPGVESAAAVFWVQTGSRDEDRRLMGVSHFLEHMAFKRTPRYTGEDIDRTFEELGAEHNAATSKEMTYYWSRVLSENLSAALDVLSELTHPLLHEDDFNSERKVILEEIARADDQPVHVLFDEFLRDYYGDHTLSWPVLGTDESIKAMSVEEMRAYWSRRYGARNIVFAVAGKFDWESVVGQMRSLTEGWQEGETGRLPAPAEFRPGIHVHVRDKFAQEQIAIGLPTVSNRDPRYYAAAVLATILGDDSGSRLYWSLTHPGIAETAEAELLAFEESGILLVFLSTDPERAAQSLSVARDELARLQSFDIAPDELERAKVKLNASVVIGGESTNERVMGLINSWLTRGRLETLEEIRRRIDAVSLDDLRALLTDFPVSPDALITAVGPLSEEKLSG